MQASKKLIYVIPTIVAIALVAFVGGRNSRSNVGKPGTTFGQIYVDTPEVYSRERLVNDRFQQDGWLRKKLAEEPESGVQVNTGASSQTSRTARVAAGGGGG